MRHKRTGPALATEIPYVGIAQLVEYLIAIQKVAGSNPVTHSIDRHSKYVFYKKYFYWV